MSKKVTKKTKPPTVSQRLAVLENEKRVRACMTAYMAFCDELNEGMDLAPLLELFTEDAVWQGRGKRYRETFGIYQGRSAIAEMFAKYTKPPAHFDMNAHFLCNELIDVMDDNATGSWMLIQPSTFSSGKSQLSCAQINAEFRLQQGKWRISVFTTTNIFSRPMADPWDSSEPLAVPDARQTD